MGAGSLQWRACKCKHCGTIHHDLTTQSSRYQARRRGRPVQSACYACHLKYGGPAAANVYLAWRQKVGGDPP